MDEPIDGPPGDPLRTVSIELGPDEAIDPGVKAFRQDSLADPDRFLARAAEALPWRRRWDRVFDWDPDLPDHAGRYFRWYIGGITNLADNCVDHNV